MAARRGKSQAKRNQGNDSLPGWAWGVIGLLLGVVLILVAPKYFKSDGDGFFRPQPNPDAQPAAVAADEEPVASEDSGATAKPARQAEPADAGKNDKADKEGPDYDFYTLLPGKEVEMSDAELAATEAAEEQRRAAQQRRNAQTAATQPQPVQAATAAQTAPTRTPAASSGSATAVSLPKPVDTIAAEPTRPAAPPVQVASATPPPSSSVTPKPPAVAATQGNLAKPAAPASDNTRYLLQAGAFQASGQAEEMKAKIAMLGLGARVESAQIGGKTVYRVRMGPYGTAGDLADAKRKLADGGLPGMAIKVQ